MEDEVADTDAAVIVGDAVTTLEDVAVAVDEWVSGGWDGVVVWVSVAVLADADWEGRPERETEFRLAESERSDEERV